MQYIDMLKAWWRHLEFPNWIFHISNISIIVTTWRSFSSKLYSLYFLSTKNAFQCCPHWKQRVQLSTLHTKVRSYILHIFLFETWFDSGSVGKTTWLGTRRRRTPTSTTPPRGWRGPGWSRHPFQVSPFCSHSVSFVLILSLLFSFGHFCSHDQTLQGKRRRNLLLELRHLEKRGGYWTVCIKNVNGRENLRKL